MNLHPECYYIFVLTHLTSYHDVRRQESCEVLVIRNDLRLVGLPLEIYSPMSKCFDNCEEFLIVNLIVTLGRGELPR
jgi:hypothetical protein